MSASLIKPATRVSTTVLIYLLKPTVNLERFLNTIKEKFPEGVVTIRTDDKGYQNVSVTTTNAKQVTDDYTPGQDAAIAGAAVGEAGLAANVAVNIFA